MKQDYSNHRRIVPAYHYVFFPVLVAILAGSVVNLIGSIATENLYSASLILALTIALMVTAILTRIFPLKAQDRAIRAEESLRHYVLTGRLLDPRLSIRQVIGLRFASDEEFVSLTARAVSENLSEDEIKQVVRSWRADHDRI